jgi:hypothetical protein
MQQDGEVTQEVLTVGPRAPRRRSPRVVWAIGMVYLVVFSLIATTALILFVARTAQADRLVSAVESSEAAMVQVQQRVGEVFEELDAEDLTEERREDLVRQLRTIAAEGEAAVAAAGERIASLRIWPVNANLEQARTAYLRHNAAWVDYLARATEDPAEFVSPQQEVNDSFFDARAPLWAAVPGIDVLGLQDRLREIYAEDGGSEGGGTLA